MQVGLQGATRSDAHQAPAAEDVDELVGVQGDGGNAHAGSHDGHRGALVGAGEAEHVAHRVELLDVLQVGLGDELRAQGVSRKQDRLGDGSGGINVRCGTHVSCPSLWRGELGSSRRLYLSVKAKPRIANVSMAI